MNDSLEYIEAYFEKQLDEAGMRQFELQCEQDMDFARDVALYITTREAMRQALVEEKAEQWRPLSEERRSTQSPVIKLIIRRWLPVAAAASLLLFAVTYFFNSNGSLNKQLADDIQQELQPPGSTMGIPDTLQLANSAYRKKELDSALLLYSAVLQIDSMHDQALLYKGRIFLKQKKYDSALHYFNKLSRMDLSNNSGPYDAALTLLERNQKGDRQKAKEHLQMVVDEKDGKLEGKERAQGLLDLIK